MFSFESYVLHAHDVIDDVATAKRKSNLKKLS